MGGLSCLHRFSRYWQSHRRGLYSSSNMWNNLKNIKAGLREMRKMIRALELLFNGGGWCPFWFRWGKSGDWIGMDISSECCGHWWDCLGNYGAKEMILRVGAIKAINFATYRHRLRGWGDERWHWNHKTMIALAALRNLERIRFGYAWIYTS